MRILFARLLMESSLGNWLLVLHLVRHHRLAHLHLVLHWVPHHRLTLEKLLLCILRLHGVVILISRYANNWGATDIRLEPVLVDNVVTASLLLLLNRC